MKISVSMGGEKETSDFEQADALLLFFYLFFCYKFSSDESE